MSVYAIVQLNITNRESYDRYQAQFWGVFKNYQGKLLVSDEEPELLEGDWPKDKIVIVQFPDKPAFMDWVTSPEYKEIAKDRYAGAKADIILAKGFSLDDPATFAK